MTEQLVARSHADRREAKEFDPRDVFYTGPGTLAGRYLRSFWQPIHLGKSLKPGQVRQIRIMGENYTLYRGESGTAHLVDNRCAHRGTQLSVGSVEGDAIRCYYHGWKYDSAGQCIEQPGEARPFCDKIRIRSFPVKDYLGVLFAYLGEGEPPLFTRYERFEANEKAVRASVEIAPFNYFQRMENSHDFVHLPFVHKQCYPKVERRSLENVVPRITTEECAWGMRTHRIDPNGLDLVAYYGMPNINYIVIGGGTGKEWEGEGEMLFFRVPIDDRNHLQFALSWIHGEDLPGQPVAPQRVERSGDDQVALTNRAREETVRAIFEGKMTIDDAIATYDDGGRTSLNLFSIEDDVAMMGQGTVWDRENEHLGSSDVAVALMRRLWAKDLRATLAGGTRQDWKRTADMVPAVAALPRDLR